MSEESKPWIATQMELVSVYLHRQELAGGEPLLPLSVKCAMLQVINALDLTLSVLEPSTCILGQALAKNTELYERLLTAEKDVLARQKRAAKRRKR